MPDLATQGRLSDASIAGTPADWTRLMRRLRTGTGIRPATLAVVRRHLEWPLADFPDLAARFTRLGLKDGAFIDVLNLATFVQPAGQAGTETVLFLHDLSEQDLTVIQRAHRRPAVALRPAARPGPRVLRHRPGPAGHIRGRHPLTRRASRR